MMAPFIFLRKLGYRNIFHLSKQLHTLELISKINQSVLLSKPKNIFTTSKLFHDVNLNEAHILADAILKGNAEDEKKKEVLKVLEILQSRGCTIEDIKNKCINYIDPNHTSYLKALSISELGLDMPLLLPLMSVSLVSLRRAAKQAREDKFHIKDFPNRIAYLSHHLEVPPDELVSILSKHTILLTMQFSKLDLRMNLLKNANISPHSLLKDLWIFYYNENLLSSRILAATKAGVEIKPWMLRSSPSTFQSMIENFVSTKEILGEDDIITYLAKKLECNEEYIKYLMDKNKLLHTINIPKLEKLLSFLFEKGYTPQEIRLFPRIFCSSVQSLEERFNEAKHLRSTLPTVSQLCASKRIFKKIVEKNIGLKSESPLTDEAEVKDSV